MTIPRGFRNNNPGNIRISEMPWRGKIPMQNNTDGTFEQFESMTYGVRAMIVLLRTYIKTKKLDTIDKIIPVYAPANENDIEAYIQVVEIISGIKRYAAINFNYDDMSRIVPAMIYHENGRALPAGIFDAAWKLI